MYRENSPPTAMESVVLTVTAGVICGGAYAFFLMGAEELWIGAILGFFGGSLSSPFVVGVTRNGAFGNVGCLSLLACLVLSVLAGVFQVNPMFALFGVAGSFVAFCALGSKWFPATRPIELFRCEACGYDLHGVNDVKCPECGRERVVLPSKRTREREHVRMNNAQDLRPSGPDVDEPRA